MASPVLTAVVNRMIAEGQKPIEEITNINQWNVEYFLDRGMLEVEMRNGRWWTIRRNGATKKWKTDPKRMRIPIKAGLRACAYLGGANGDEWPCENFGFRVKPSAAE